MFHLGINRSGITQGFYPMGGQSTMVWVEPNGVADFTGRVGLPTGFEPIDDFLKEAQRLNAQRLYIQRSFALGDTLLAIPMLRELKRLGWDCYLRASNQYTAIMSYLDVPFQEMRGAVRKGDVGLVADWLLEQDHVDSEKGRLHRVQIYAAALGITTPAAVDIDWSMDISRLPDIPELAGEKYIVLQTSGANEHKSLPLRALEAIAIKLNKAGIRVCHIGPPDTAPFNTPLDHRYVNRLSIPALFSLIARAECAVVMDSAPLWVTHFTTTPVIAILGPTSCNQRLSLHPLAPEGVRAIQLEQRIDCDPCQEKALACSQRFDCLKKVDADALATTVLECVQEFVS